MPPPPWELLVTDSPSIRDGLHWKLLGNGLGLAVQLALVRSVVPAGKISATNGSDGKFTPFESTVIPAPSYAPLGLFLQLFRQVTVQSSIPPDRGLQRQAIHLRIEGRWGEVTPASPTAGLYPSGTPEGPARTGNHPQPPIIEENAGRMRICVDDGGGSSDTLQPDRLPHQQQFMMGTGEAQ